MGNDRVEASFEADPAAVGACRAFVRATLTAWDCDDPEEVAVLLTGEVVTNAILHAGTEFRVGLTLHEYMLEVEVEDRSAALPQLRPLDALAMGGRGMWLVHRLAQAWGTRLTCGGKVVWFRVTVLPHHPSAGLASQSP